MTVVAFILSISNTLPVSQLSSVSTQLQSPGVTKSIARDKNRIEKSSTRVLLSVEYAICCYPATLSSSPWYLPGVPLVQMRTKAKSTNKPRQKCLSTATLSGSLNQWNPPTPITHFPPSLKVLPSCCVLCKSGDGTDKNYAPARGDWRESEGYEYMASKELIGGIFTAERDNYRYKEMAKM